MIPPASTAQKRTIHTLKGRLGLADDTYRDFLEQQAGVRSSSSLTIAQARTVIDRLKVLETRPRVPAARGALRLDGPYAAICRALWISGFNLGVFAHREDTALAAFVRRQTGVDSLNWVRDPADGRAVVQALKSWIAREAGVKWPRQGGAAESKRAVVAAQLDIIERANPEAVGPLKVAADAASDAHLDELMAELGSLIRGLPGVRGA